METLLLVLARKMVLSKLELKGKTIGKVAWPQMCLVKADIVDFKKQSAKNRTLVLKSAGLRVYFSESTP